MKPKLVEKGLKNFFRQDWKQSYKGETVGRLNVVRKAHHSPDFKLGGVEVAHGGAWNRPRTYSPQLLEQGRGRLK